MIKQAKAFPEVCEASFDNPVNIPRPTPEVSRDVEIRIDGLSSLGGDKFVMFNVPTIYVDPDNIRALFGLDDNDNQDELLLGEMLKLFHKHSLLKVLMERIV